MSAWADVAFNNSRTVEQIFTEFYIGESPMITSSLDIKPHNTRHTKTSLTLTLLEQFKVLFRRIE